MTLKELYDTLEPSTLIKYFAPGIDGFGTIDNICWNLPTIESIIVVKMELQIETHNDKLVPVMYLWFH